MDWPPAREAPTASTREVMDHGNRPFLAARWGMFYFGFAADFSSHFQNIQKRNSIFQRSFAGSLDDGTVGHGIAERHA